MCKSTFTCMMYIDLHIWRICKSMYIIHVNVDLYNDVHVNVNLYNGVHHTCKCKSIQCKSIYANLFIHVNVNLYVNLYTSHV